MKPDPARAFLQAPYRTLMALSIPVTLSMIAEPITGIVDTAFLAREGAVAVAGLGIGTATLSSLFWIFNFLGITTQTEVARASGAEDSQRVREVTSLAIFMALVNGVLVILLFLPLAPQLAALLGGSGDVQREAVTYLQLRMFGAPAVLGLMVGFGALRGQQDMHTPLWIAVGLNAANIALDALLIPGVAPFPALGVAGAAVASTIAQWLGFMWVMWVLWRRFGFVRDLKLADVRLLLRVGSDLFVRTGTLTLFLLLTTRVANDIGPNAGAAHQAIRSIWIFTGLFLDGLAVSAQSLIGYFLGTADRVTSRYAARISAIWSLAMGTGLGLAMLLLTPVVTQTLVPPDAVAYFLSAWWLAAMSQPANGLAFVTDGIHWGTGDYAFLRSAMLLATAIASFAVLLIDAAGQSAFVWLWLAMLFWILLRAATGITRIWPGYGKAPLGAQPAASG
jgi:multidrug resistance protein, MATE family